MTRNSANPRSTREQPRQILVDHGLSHNLGDTAMLEGAVGRLLDRHPMAHLHVLDWPNLQTQIWRWPRVYRVSFDIDVPESRIRFLYHLPYIWRYRGSMAATWLALNLASLGTLKDPQSLRVTGERLGAFCKNFDAYHVVGGGNFTDTFPGQVWKRCCLIHGFADQGKPVVLTGQQVGPWRSKAVGRAAGRALRRAEFLGLREPTDSVAYCRRVGIETDRYKVMGDDSFGLAPADAEAVSKVLDQRGAGDSPFIAVNVRFADYADSHSQHLGKIADLMDFLRNRYRLPLVVVPIALNQTDSDIDSGRRLAEQVGGDSIKVLDGPDLTASLVKGVLGRAHAAIGISYHFCTFALSLGIPAACLHDGAYYGQKARGLAAFWGDDRIDADLGSRLEKLQRNIAGLIDDDRFRAGLPGLAEKLTHRWGSIFDSAIAGTNSHVWRSIHPTP